jgi:hypothetical protein
VHAGFTRRSWCWVRFWPKPCTALTGSPDLPSIRRHHHGASSSRVSGGHRCNSARSRHRSTAAAHRRARSLYGLRCTSSQAEPAPKVSSPLGRANPGHHLAGNCRSRQRTHEAARHAWVVTKPSAHQELSAHGVSPPPSPRPSFVLRETDIRDLRLPRALADAHCLRPLRLAYGGSPHRGHPTTGRNARASRAGRGESATMPSVEAVLYGGTAVFGPFEQWESEQVEAFNIRSSCKRVKSGRKLESSRNGVDGMHPLGSRWVADG